MENELRILVTDPQDGYELIDSGQGEKLERFGQFVLRRPDPQALWMRSLPETEWKKADAVFEHSGTVGKWKRKNGLPEWWKIELGGLSFRIELSPFKHTGIFPEQLSNWMWMREKIQKSGRPVKALNLFGYTGGATLAAAAAGAEVVHVDASKGTIGTARENAELSGLSGKKIRWMLDDARKFVQREARRKNAYDGIIMDPPAFGHGAKGEVWKIEEQFVPLLNDIKKILSSDPVFLVVNGYASGYSSIAYKNSIEELVGTFGGAIEAGELAIRESKAGRLLPAGIFARWSK